MLESAEYQEPTPKVTAKGKYITEFVETAMERAKDYGMHVDSIYTLIRSSCAHCETPNDPVVQPDDRVVQARSEPTLAIGWVIITRRSAAPLSWSPNARPECETRRKSRRYRQPRNAGAVVKKSAEPMWATQRLNRGATSAHAIRRTRVRITRGDFLCLSAKRLLLSLPEKSASDKLRACPRRDPTTRKQVIRSPLAGTR
jgi:hypothetical protein